MPRYQNTENGQEMDATEEFAAVALPSPLYKKVASESSDERAQREMIEARDAKVTLEEDTEASGDKPKAKAAAKKGDSA